MRNAAAHAHPSMPSTRQSARAASKAVREQLQAMQGDEVTPSSPPTTAVVAIDDKSPHAPDDPLLFEDCIPPSATPPPEHNLSSAASRISPSKTPEITPVDPASPKPRKRVSEDFPLKSPKAKVPRTAKKGAKNVKLTGPLTPHEEGTVVDRELLIDMEMKSCISLLSLSDKEISPKQKVVQKKQVTDSVIFEKACFVAAKDPTACANRLINLADGSIDALLEFANILVKGPVGIVGSRRQLRATAMQLIDKVLEMDENHVLALCMKGEMLMPKRFFGTGHANTPNSIMKLAYAYFTKADLLGSREGRFLRGRWLMTMMSIHQSAAKRREGKRYVDEAAMAGHARAYVFKAQMLEFPDNYGWDGTVKASDRQMIVKWYMKAAEMGNGEALNDVGSSYASSFGGLPSDFDAAVKYYVRAIKAGCLTAFENLGTHYETGMSGIALDRIDYRKALHYYRAGMQMRCAKCAFNMASAYDEGLGDVVAKNFDLAEKYYKHCMLLAYDEEDEGMKLKATKALVAMYVTCLKLSEPGSEAVQLYMDKLRVWLNKRMLAGTLAQVNKCLAAAVDSGEVVDLEELLGSGGARELLNAGMIIAEEVRVCLDELDEGVKTRLKHMFGASADEVEMRLKKARAIRRRVST